MIKKALTPLIILLSGVIVLSTAGPVIKLYTFQPMKLAFYRLFFGLIAFLVFFLLKREKSPYKMSRRDFLFFSLGGLFLALHFFIWITSFSYTTVAGGVVPILIQPILVSILSWLFYREGLSLKLSIPLIISFSGITIMTWRDIIRDPVLGTGDLLAVLGIAMVSIYFLVARKAVQKAGPIRFNIVTYSIACLFLLVLLRVQDISLMIHNTRELVIILWLGIACSFFGYLSVNYALKTFTTPEVSIALIGEPVLSVVWAGLFLAEPVHLSQQAGLYLGVLGLVLFVYIKSKDRKRVSK